MAQSDGRRRYSDPEGLRNYTDRDEWEVCVEREVPVSPEQAFDAWFSSIWEGHEGPVMLNPGEGRARSGSVRRVPLARMTERIVGVGLPAPSSAAEVVPSISYTVEHFSASSSLGYVRFVPTGSGPEATRIVWGVKWTPSLAGRLVFVGGHVLVRMLTSAMRQGLDSLEQEATGRAATP